jgi:endonuclease III
VVVVPLALRAVVTSLRRYYGLPPPPISRNPFHLVLWEQVAYLVPDGQRLAAYAALRTQVGLTPAAVLAAPAARLKAIARVGGSIAAPARAARLRRSAELAVEKWDGDLRRALKLPEVRARRALAQFPMIGEPGADKILLFSRTVRLLALDSNALRVLQRLGIAKEARDYRASYRQAQAAVTAELPGDFAWLVSASQLLRRHGQELCRRGAPDCAPCPLRLGCPVGSRTQ